MTISKNPILKILQILFYIFPISIYSWQFSNKLNLTIIIILGLIYFKKDIFKIQNNFLLLTIITFFFMLLFTTYYNYFFVESNKDAIKSLFYFRYLFLLLIIRALIINNLIKKLFFKHLFFTLLFYLARYNFQSFIGKNILGLA